MSKSSKTKVKIGHGVFGFVIHDKLNAELTELVKPSGKYYSGSEGDLKKASDQGFPYLNKKDIKGWYYNKSAILALLDSNTDVDYLGHSILSIEDIATIDDANEKQAQEKIKRKE